MPDAITKLKALLLMHPDASDLHLKSNMPYFWRQEGKLYPAENLLSHCELEKICQVLLNDAQKNMLLLNGHIDTAFQINALRFRLNIYKCQNYLSFSIRYIKQELYPLEKEDSCLFDLMQKTGLFLITGPCGSGKSSTLATLINARLKAPCHLITLEDPIEYLFSSPHSLIHQREYGLDFHDFSTALKGALRQDPDIIMVGEIRDAATMQAALTAAQTGHLVLSTLHTSSCTEAISRVEGFFESRQRDLIRLDFSQCLLAIVAQRLLCGADNKLHCAREIMLATPAVRNLIASGNLQQLTSQIQMGAQNGMRTMKQALEKIFFQENALR